MPEGIDYALCSWCAAVKDLEDFVDYIAPMERETLAKVLTFRPRSASI